MKKQRATSSTESMRRLGGAGIRRGTTWLQSDRRRDMEPRLAPPKRAERQHARPGAGIKRSRAAMARRAR